MMKRNKWTVLLSSFVTVAPALFGLAVWDILPEYMAIHWGIDGSVDGWSSPLFAVLFLPLFMLVLHLACIFITAKDNKSNGQHKKIFSMALWICPAISLYAGGLMYATAFGSDINIMVLSCIILGLLFIVMGNYMPKCKQNRTIGFKTTWTVANEQNWNATHRFGGKVMVIVGAAILLCAFLPPIPLLCLFFSLILAGCLAPVVYSYLYYRKQLQRGEAVKSDFAMKKSDKITSAIVLSLVVIILAACFAISFTGNIVICFPSDSTLLIEASYHDDLSIEYSDIEHIEYCESGVSGQRIYGFASPRLLIGQFQNEEFGTYTRYTYANCTACIVLTLKGKTVVINCPDAAQTKELYGELTARIHQIRRN
ncbi:MAG: SdpI family protein [Clostridia bacterium]|nr:SdpI family protein [Clostridia bacterium]